MFLLTEDASMLGPYYHGVYNEESNAIDALNNAIAWIKKDDTFYNEDGSLKAGIVEDKGETSYEVWEDGFYAENHIALFITEVKMMD